MEHKNSLGGAGGGATSQEAKKPGSDSPYGSKPRGLSETADTKPFDQGSGSAVVSLSNESSLAASVETDVDHQTQSPTTLRTGGDYMTSLGRGSSHSASSQGAEKTRSYAPYGSKPRPPDEMNDRHVGSVEEDVVLQTTPPAWSISEKSSTTTFPGPGSALDQPDSTIDFEKKKDPAPDNDKLSSPSSSNVTESDSTSVRFGVNEVEKKWYE